MSPLVEPFMPKYSADYKESSPHGAEENCYSNPPRQTKWSIWNRKTRKKNSCSVRLTRLVRVIEQKDCEESFLVLCEGGDVEGQLDFTARRLWLQTAVTVRGRDLGNSAGGAEGVQVCLV